MSKSVAIVNRDVRKENMKRDYERKVWFANFIYFAKQKLLGLLLIAVTVWVMNSGLMFDAATELNDCTFAFVTVPLGLMFLFSRKKIIL